MRFAFKRTRWLAVSFLCGVLLCAQVPVWAVSKAADPVKGATRLTTKKSVANKKATKKAVRKAAKGKKHPPKKTIRYRR